MDILQLMEGIGCGLVGSAVIKEGQVINLNYISGLNFRISRQIYNCSSDIIEHILDRSRNKIFNTLIVSPPGIGKTTLLKDIIRHLSNGIEKDGVVKFKGINITIALYFY